MSLLLDTHALVWARQGDRRLGSGAKRAIASVDPGGLAIADVTLFELSLLLARGKIESSLPAGQFLRRAIAGISVLPVTVEVALRAVDLPLPKGDPFDRLIVATAMEHGMSLVTRDRAIVGSGILPTIW